MIDIAQSQGVTFVFNKKVWDIDLPTATIYTGGDGLDTSHSISFDHIFGADGAFSKVRYKMQRKSRYDYNQKFLDTGYKELTIPPNKDGTHFLDKNGLHIWPRGKYMLIALPNLDGSFTATLFMPFEGKISFKSLAAKNDLKSFFTTQFPDLKKIIPDLIEECYQNPMSSFAHYKMFSMELLG